MEEKTKSILKTAGIVAGTVTAACTATVFTAKKLLDIAMNKDGVKPTAGSAKVRNKLCGFTNEDGFIDELESAGLKLKEVETEEVSITGEDGTKLTGHLYTCEYPKRLIIAVHGWRSTWNRDFGLAADFWFENNCNVLFVEQRCQGKSEGEYIGFGLLERYDCRDWANWAHERYEGKLPIYLDGISMGATTVLMASGLKLPDSVKGIIADSGFTSPRGIWKHVTEHHMHLKYGPISGLADAICRQKINVGAEDYSTVEALKENNIPVLFVHGTDDPFVPVEMTYENYLACKAPKRLVIVPGAVHGLSFYVEKERCAEEIRRFWSENDG
ncbi:MAG: alpha/beta hydrolase [Bacillota bacterium]|nr:alpha/beta hydrolase [Bacillota bacterium]